MTPIHLISPPGGDVSLEELRKRIAEAQPGEPFSPQMIRLCSSFGMSLFRAAPRGSAVKSLGFFLREAHLAELRDQFVRSQARNAIYAPRGMVFLIPPANVPSLAVYSWVFAAITGNIVVVRLPSAPSDELDMIMSCFTRTFSEAPASTFFLKYGHDDDLNRTLSQWCDMRVIWGGDDTVRYLRQFPLAPGARDLTFPDRYSLAVMSAPSYNSLVTQEREALVSAAFRDLYTFDQVACSSPRLLVWAGPSDACEEASSDFYQRLSAYAAGRYACELSSVISKKVFVCEAILDQGVRSESFSSNELTVIRVDSLDRLTREHCGGGLLFEYFARELRDLGSFISQKDQTLTYFGFTPAEISEFVHRIGARGLDRVVPMGQALTFSHLWDGYDLLQEFVRRIHLVPQSHEVSEPAAVG